MKPALAILLFGGVALVLRGVLAALLPAGLCPDLGLLVVIGLGLQLPGATGLLLAALLGYAADVLAGSLLGQHALLFVLFFAATRVVGAQLDLQRGAPLVILTAAITAVHGIGLVSLSRFFADAASWPTAGQLGTQALVNAVVAPFVAAAIAAIAARLSDEERRAVELAPRQRAL